MHQLHFEVTENNRRVQSVLLQLKMKMHYPYHKVTKQAGKQEVQPKIRLRMIPHTVYVKQAMF